jgi:hypothetical protein
VFSSEFTFVGRQNYGSKVQLTPAVLDSATLTPQGRKRIQQVVGALLYYGRAIDGMIMMAISSLASQQATSTEDTEAKLIQLLNYSATHPDATIRYRASNMILNIHSDAGNLNEPEARSRAGGHFFMSSKPINGEQQHNGSILTLSTILRMVVASAAEAEIGALFLNAKEGVNIRNILKEMWHPQLATPMQTDNTTAHGILRGTCKQQRSKAIDMRLYWVRDRAQQGQFDIEWGPSVQNLGGYFTKHHPPPPTIKGFGVCTYTVNIHRSTYQRHIKRLRKGVLIVHYLPARQPVIKRTRP